MWSKTAGNSYDSWILMAASGGSHVGCPLSNDTDLSTNLEESDQEDTTYTNLSKYRSTTITRQHQSRVSVLKCLHRLDSYRFAKYREVFWSGVIRRGKFTLSMPPPTLLKPLTLFHVKPHLVFLDLSTVHISPSMWVPYFILAWDLHILWHPLRKLAEWYTCLSI